MKRAFIALAFCFPLSACVHYRDKDVSFTAIGVDSTIVLPGKLRMPNANLSNAFGDATDTLQEAVKTAATIYRP